MRQHALSTFVFETGNTYVRIPTGHEFRYVPDLMGGVLGLERKSGFESDEISSVLKTLPKNPIILDVGANFGYYSIVIASSDLNGEVHSFEPVSEAFSLLTENIDRNSVSHRITPNKIAIGESKGVAEITSDRYAGNYLIDKGSYDGFTEKVSMTTLDQYVLENNIKKVDFIKCDVEGSELQVMKGAFHILKNMKPLVMLEIAEEWTSRFGYTAYNLREYMSTLGYIETSMMPANHSDNHNLQDRKETHNYFFKSKDVFF